MATENEAGVEIEETLELPEVVEGEEDTTDYKEEALKLRDKAIAQRERTKAIKKERDEAKKALETLSKVKGDEPSKSKTGELDETQLDYLDLKGFTEADDIKIIERHVQRTGETVRQALKDEYVLSKLEANKAHREVKDATPSGTKRGGNQSNDLASALAKFEQTGELPTDFTLRSAVVNAKVDKSNSNKPAWH